MQLDLFEQRTKQTNYARNALKDFDLFAAKQAFCVLLEKHPQDVEASKGLEISKQLISRLSLYQAECDDIVLALLMMEDEIEQDHLRGLHRRIAKEAENIHGPGCFLPDDMPAGYHWKLGGDLKEAKRSLFATLSKTPTDARVRSYLGDVLFLDNDKSKARAEYLLAFLMDPTAVSLKHLADPAVAALPDLTQSMYGVSDNALDWVCSVGTVEGVFTLPPPVIPGILDPMPTDPKRNTAGTMFYRHILEERNSSSQQDRINIRRQMKQLCPELLAAYLKRFCV